MIHVLTCTLMRAVPQPSRTRTRMEPHRTMRRCMWGRRFGGLLTALGPLALSAQQAAEPATALPPAYLGIPSSPADTGRMIQGWHDFRRYDWSDRNSACEFAAGASTFRVWRHGEFDTATYARRVSATTPPAVIAIMRACGVDLAAGVQQVKQAGSYQVFWPAFHIALALHRDDLLQTLVRAQLAHHPDVREQGVLLNRVVLDLFRTAHPPRPALVTALLPVFDSLAQLPKTPPAVWEGRAWARHYLWRHFLQLGDTAQARSAIEDAIAAYKTVPANFGIESDFSNLYECIMYLTILEHGVRSPETIAFLHRMDAVWHGPHSTFQYLPGLRLYGQSFRYPDGAYWFSADGTPSGYPSTGPGTEGPAGPVGGGMVSPIPIPVPTGKVTLVWNPTWDGDHGCILKRNNESCARIWGTLRRLMARYGPRGMQLVILEHTRGYAQGFSQHEPVTASGLLPEQEAAAVRQFYQDQLGLKGYIAVETAPFRITPDGRRINGNTAWEALYLRALGQEPTQGFFGASGISNGGDGDPATAPPWVWVLDKQGRIQWISPEIVDLSEGRDDPVLELFLTKLLQAP